MTAGRRAPAWTNPPGSGHDLPHFLPGVYIWRRTGAARQKAPVNHTGSRIEVRQIPAELAQHGDMVDPGADAQGFQALDPAVGDFARDGFSRLEFAQQKAVQADEEFLAGDAPPAGRFACFQKTLEPESQWTAEKARRHIIILSPARAWPLRAGFSSPPSHR